VRALGTTRRQVRDLLQGAVEVSSLRGVKRMEFPVSVRKKAFTRWLARVWTKIDAIRTKQAAKPKHSPVPQ
jgi:hypothetical protein